MQGISHDNPNGIVVLRGGERGDKTNFENWNQDQYIVGEKNSFTIDNIDTKKRRVNLAPFLTSTKGLIYK